MTRPDMQNEILRRLENGEISVTKAFNLLNQSSTGLEYNSKTYDIKENINRLEECLNELDKMIGLKRVKKLIHEYQAFIEIQKRRKNVGLKVEPLVMHMIFKGNPGTGKTTVARIIGKAFKELGVIEKGHMIEAERADLVGEYIGHTAQKTRKLIQKAIGGILFVDEAYSLARGGERDFGKEAIDTMVKALEDHKDKLIIILAGYRDEMDDFLATNPGLKSRFPIHLDFEDYSLEELVSIAKKFVDDKEYKLSSTAKTYLYRLLSSMRMDGDLHSGNARTVRNLIERAIRLQAVRLLDEEEFRKEGLMVLERRDLEKGVAECPDV
ncbi:MAG: AAA family ATPase [Halanaerobiales bacterium]|nr:AAA family ATPase [Halanaerobiales bacterium]